jgi:putative membrane protein
MMKAPRKIWPLILLLGIGGGALFATLVVKHGAADIAGAVAAAGWGVAAVTLFHFVTLFCDTLGWRAVLPRERRPSLGWLFSIRWMGDSVSSMLPVAQVGGEIVRVRLTAARGVPLPAAAASVLVGMTVSVATQIIFTLSGLFVLALESGRDGLFWPTLAGSLIAVLAVVGFYFVQHLGIFRIMGAIVSRLARSEAWQGLAQRGHVLDEEVRALYARRRAVMACCLWTFAVWATGAVEVWIALAALGLPASYGRAFALESMAQAIRSAAFLVPGALGVQEGGYVIVGGLLGISPADCMALALIRRMRELAFGVPGVISWQRLEGFAWWKRRTLERPAAEVRNEP